MEGAGSGASSAPLLLLLLRQDTKALSELEFLIKALMISYAWSSYALINDTYGSYSLMANHLALCSVN